MTDTRERQREAGTQLIDAAMRDGRPSGQRAKVKPHVSKSLVEFCANMKPRTPLIHGLLPRGMIYALTGRTGHGKTTISTLLQLCVATGTAFAGRRVVRGRVLVLCGENPEDYAWHMRAQLESFAMDAEELAENFRVVDIVVPVDELLPELHELASAVPFALVVVDTSAAFFMGLDENDNAQMRNHAVMLRSLTRLNGAPAVLVLCHPSKQATQENMMPRGGGAFLAEIDGNWELWKPEGEDVATMRASSKIRGVPPWEPLHFHIAPVMLKAIAFPDGTPLTTSVARHVDDAENDGRHAKFSEDQKLLLEKIWQKPGATQRDLALACGWSTGAGDPSTGRVSRVVKALRSQRLIDVELGKLVLTAGGKRALERA